MGCTKNPTHHQNCIIFCAFAILVAFARLEGKGGGGWGAMGWEENKTSQIYYMVVFATCVGGRGDGVGWRKIPPTIKNILHLLYVLYWLHLQNLWERGDGGLDTNPTHHQNCIIFGAFVILVAFATCVGTHRKCIAAYKKYVKIYRTY